MSATGQMVYAMLVASGLSSAAVVQVIPMIPRPERADYFEVASVTAERAGDTAVLQVSRQIKEPLLMTFDVRVFRVDEEGAHMVCTGHGGPYSYRPDAVLPEPITLSWWTNGACDAIPPGRIEIETTWDPVVPDFPPISITTEVQE